MNQLSKGYPMSTMNTVYREGDRIRATDGQGYSDRVTDNEIRGHMPSKGPDAAMQDAFCRAVLAIRGFERLAAEVSA